MAQGKLKVKSKGGSKPPSKKKHEKKPQGLKKGKLAIAPKKQVSNIYFLINALQCCKLKQKNLINYFQHHQEDHKFKKNIQKLINSNIEKQVKEKAKNFDPKAFLSVDKEAGAASTSKE